MDEEIIIDYENNKVIIIDSKNLTEEGEPIITEVPIEVYYSKNNK